MKKTENLKRVALVAAAGSGSRFNAEQNKQFLVLDGYPVLALTLLKLSKSSYIDEIVIIARDFEIGTINKLINDFSIKKVSSIISGGKTRQESVYNGLKSISDNSVVLIHDGARPFFPDESLKDLISSAKEFGGAALGVLPKDTVAKVDKDGIFKESANRSDLRNMQTPQVFKTDLIKDAHEKAKKENLEFTDDCSLFSYYGGKCLILDGDYDNIKITVPEDLKIAQLIVKKENL